MAEIPHHLVRHQNPSIKISHHHCWIYTFHLHHPTTLQMGFIQSHRQQPLCWLIPYHHRFDRSRENQKFHPEELHMNPWLGKIGLCLQGIFVYKLGNGALHSRRGKEVDLLPVLQSSTSPPSICVSGAKTFGFCWESNLQAESLSHLAMRITSYTSIKLHYHLTLKHDMEIKKFP